MILVPKHSHGSLCHAQIRGLGSPRQCMSEMNGANMCRSVSSRFLQEITMSSATGVREPGDWFTAAADVPSDVAVLNFVVQYYEHFDNNYGLDYKTAVQFDSHGRCDAVLCLTAGLHTCVT